MANLFGFRAKSGNKTTVPPPQPTVVPPKPTPPQPIVIDAKYVNELGNKAIYQKNLDSAWELYAIHRHLQLGFYDMDRAFFWLRYCAEMGDSKACVQIGDAYRDGERFVSRNLDTAWKFYDKARTLGNTDAIERMKHFDNILFMMNDEYIESLRCADEYDPLNTESLIEDILGWRNGNPSKLNNVGVHFANGLGVKKNYRYAYICFAENLTKDNIAPFNMSRLYASGLGVEINLHKAIDLTAPPNVINCFANVKQRVNLSVAEIENEYDKAVSDGMKLYWAKLGAKKGSPYLRAKYGFYQITPLYREQNMDEAMFYYALAIKTAGGDERVGHAYGVLLNLMGMSGKYSEALLDSIYHEARISYPKQYQLIGNARVFWNDWHVEIPKNASHQWFANEYLNGIVYPFDASKALEHIGQLEDEDLKNMFHAKLGYAKQLAPNFTMNGVMYAVSLIKNTGNRNGTLAEILVDEYNRIMMAAEKVVNEDVCKFLLRHAISHDYDIYISMLREAMTLCKVANIDAIVADAERKGSADREKFREYRSRQEQKFQVFNVNLMEDEPEDTNIEPESDIPPSENNAEKELPENLDIYFEGMIGMEPVKKQLDKIYQSVKLQVMREKILREKGMEPGENAKGYNFILLGNPGTGKTTVARIIARILYDIGIRKSESFMEVERSAIVSDHIGGTETRMKDILDEIQGGTLFIDEAYTLYKEDSENDFGKEAIDLLMKDMEDSRNSYSVIMAGYKEPMLNMVKNANSGFRSRFTYQIELPDYNDKALVEMAHVEMEKQNFTVDADVDNAIIKAIHHDRIDETFGNARYIRELVNRAVENQAHRLHMAESFEPDELFMLKGVDFFEGFTEEKSVNEYLEELNCLIGLSSVKEEVNSLISMITVQKEMEKRGMGVAKGLGTLHMAFKGNPGTGKTTVARIIGKIYTALGVLKRGDVFVECSRADLVAEYQGQTAVKVKKVVQSALGGILFIDEAYSLVYDEGDTFGHEAVDMLVSEMENNRDNLLVIFAGYSKELNKFFENNQGLRSRVPKELLFEDYSAEELYEIAEGMVKSKGMSFTQDARESLTCRIQQEVTSTLSFGNARGVRNIIDDVIRRQNVRIAGLMMNNDSVADEELLTIDKEDI